MNDEAIERVVTQIATTYAIQPQNAGPLREIIRAAIAGEGAASAEGENGECDDCGHENGGHYSTCRSVTIVGTTRAAPAAKPATVCRIPHGVGDTDMPATPTLENPNERS